MIALPKPDIILTHESDLDGFVSGLLLQKLARKVFNLDPPLETYQADAWRQRAPKESAAWVADFAFEARLDQPNWLILDHHPSQAKPAQAQLIHDPLKSAGHLCYDLCREHDLATPALDRLIRWNDVADQFLVEDPEFWTAMDYASLVKTYQFWNLYELVEGDPERLVDHPLLEVMAVKRRIEDPLGLTWSERHITEITPTVGLVDTVIGNTNLILHQLLERGSTPFQVLLTLYRKGNGNMVVSLRSRQGQALKTAERLQGGGHENAAGAVLPRSLQRRPDAIDYLRKTLNPTPSRHTPLNSLESLFDEIELR